jgi:AcrR family transcriptional regulator
MMNKSGVRGRRPGRPETRARVLEVARRRFLADGYQATTMRSIAADAEVDVALVSYFFGSKKGLFGAALALSANPPEILVRALPGDPNRLPERVLRALLDVWEDPERAGSLRVMIAGAISDPDVARLVKEVFEQEMVDRIAEHIGGSRARMRAAAFTSLLAGLIFTRYILGLDPVATMTADELIRSHAPCLRVALVGPTPRKAAR